MVKSGEFDIRDWFKGTGIEVIVRYNKKRGPERIQEGRRTVRKTPFFGRQTG